MEKEPINSGQDSTQHSLAAIRGICEYIHTLKPSDYPPGLTFYSIGLTEADPRRVEERIYATQAADLLLKDGETFSIPNGGDYYPELNLFKGVSRLAGVYLDAVIYPFEDAVRDENGNPIKDEADEYVMEPHAMHSLTPGFLYGRRMQSASQRLVLETSTTHDSVYMGRSLSAPAYAETGYEGHGHVGRTISDDRDIADVIALYSDLIEEYKRTI